MNTEDLCRIIYMVDGPCEVEEEYDIQEDASDAAKDAVISHILETTTDWEIDASDILCDSVVSVIKKAYTKPGRCLSEIKDAAYLFFESRLIRALADEYPYYCRDEEVRARADAAISRYKEQRATA